MYHLLRMRILILMTLFLTATSVSSADSDPGGRPGGGAEDLLSPAKKRTLPKKKRDPALCKNAAGETIKKGDPGFESCTAQQPPEGLVHAHGSSGYSSGQAGMKLHF